MSRLSGPCAQNLRRLALFCLMSLTTLLLTACAHHASTDELRTVAAKAADLYVQVPPLARESCLPADLPPRRPPPGEVEWQAFSVDQTGKLENCDTKRALAVAAGDLHNLYVKKLSDELEPPTWWERVTGREKEPPAPAATTIEDLLAADAAQGR